MGNMQHLKLACQKSLRGLKRAAPTILSAAAAVGVVGTAILAARATTKASELLQAAADEKGTALTTLEVVRVAGPSYIPAAATGVSTICCIFGANLLNRRQQASMMSAYGLLNQSYQRYRKAATEVYGGDADRKINSQMAKDTYISADGRSVYSPEQDRVSEKIQFHDSFSNRYFMATIPAVLNAQYHLNRNLTLRGEATINEFYRFLGVDEVDGGDEVGWSTDELMESGILWLDFENIYTKMEDGMECCIVSACIDPDILNGCDVPF